MKRQQCGTIEHEEQILDDRKESTFREIDSKLKDTELKAVNELVRSILDAAGDPIVLVGTDYEVKFLNRAARENFVDGRGKEAAYCYQLFYDRDTHCCGTAYPCSLEKVRESLRPFTVVQEHPKGGNSRSIIEIVATPLLGEDGALFGIVKSVRDVTERVQAVEALRVSKERFRSLFEHAVIGLYRTTPDGRILMANPALVKMLSYSSVEEMTQRKLEESGFEPSYPRAHFKQRIESEGRVIGLESAWHTRDGHVLFVRESARAFYDDAGNVQYYEGTVEDITERKRAEEALRKLKDKLEIRVAERTSELTAVNETLCQQIDERKRVEESLRKSEKRMSQQNVLLQEKNMALREMTEQLRAEKERVEKQVATNVDRLLVPLLAKMRKDETSSDRTYINLLEKNVKQLTSTFGFEISSKMLGLTPREIKICNMIRNGMKSKDIAHLLKTSRLTVERHRRNLRRKLGLTNTKQNLTTYLQSL